jgi:transcriptional regulator with XRE-family HTH domain
VTWFERRRDPQEQHGFDLIGAEVRRRRYALGWSQRVLEAQSGIDQTVISRIENGKQYGIRWSRFARLVDALGGLGPLPAREPWPGNRNHSRGESATVARDVDDEDRPELA